MKTAQHNVWARWLGAVLSILTISAPSTAPAQWSRVTEIPSVNIYNVWTNGNMITAGSDSTAFLSIDAGATWIPTAKVAAGATSVQAVRYHNGRLYAGTYGQGVFVSNDLGVTWASFNQGLTGGLANLFITDLLVHADTLYAATGGAGAWRRNLATSGTWTRYGDIFGPAQASNMEGIAASDTRLFASAGANGDAYFRDFGQPDWTLTWLTNDGHIAGLAALSAIWTGRSWLVGSNIGAFHSALGQEPWTYTDFGLRLILFMSFALRSSVVFVHFASNEGTGIEYSRDDGVTWQVLDRLPLTFTYNVATIGDTLYGGRVDGLWRRSIATITSVSTPPDGAPGSLHFVVLGRRPARGEVRFRFDLPRAGRVRIDIFDVAGRRVPGGIDEELPAGANEVSWKMSDVASGIYLARIHAAGRSEVARVVRIK